jgi:hypothetical protein
MCHCIAMPSLVLALLGGIYGDRFWSFIGRLMWWAAGLFYLAADPVRFAAGVTGFCGGRECGGAKGKGGDDGSDQDSGVLFHCERPPVLIR